MVDTVLYSHATLVYMATKIQQADYLVRGSKGGQHLDEFITEHMDSGGDNTSLAAAIAIATGAVIFLDSRTAQSWIDQAEAGTLL